MEYKRLTNNNLDEYNPEYDFCVGCEHFGEPNGCNRPNGTCGNYERFMETYNRLAELEDKIENGTLIELPCKVGDTVYILEKAVLRAHWDEHRYIVDEWDKLAVYEKEFNLVLFAVSKVGKDYFLTREKAEKRLKEIQE